MGKLMPGRIRQAGIDLYEAGHLRLKTVQDKRFLFDCQGVEVEYDLRGQEVVCQCADYGLRQYCLHQAAVEYYFNNHPEGKMQLLAHQEEVALQVEILEENPFIESLKRPYEDGRWTYRLSVHGQVMAFEKTIDWTLKISRYPDDKWYVVRDIGAFLKVVANQGNYQFGKHYFEQLTYADFDQASQFFLDFLDRLQPHRVRLDDPIFVNMGRHLRLPLVAFEEGLELMQDLADFQFEHQLKAYDAVAIGNLQADQELYRFQVKVETNYFLVVFEEKPVLELYKGRFLLVGNQFYLVSRQQERIRSVLLSYLDLSSGQGQVRVEFRDQDQLALILLDLAQLGPVVAPKQFEIRDFKPEFHFDQTESGEISLALQLRFSRVLVTSREELDQLPFASHKNHLDAVLDMIDKAGFVGDFQALHAPMSGADLYRFFTQKLEQFSKMGLVHLSPSLKALQVSPSPKIQIEKGQGLLQVLFDFDGIDQEEVDAALSALFSQEAYYSTRQGKLLVFDQETRAISQTLQELRIGRMRKGGLSVPSFRAHQLAESLAGRGEIAFSKEFLEMARYLARPESFPMPDVQITSQLRDYQKVGIQWLANLDYFGFGGILADEMGLGKTLQTIAFLSTKKSIDGKVLILAPSSLIYNWQDEFHQFAPQMDLVVVNGSKDQRVSLLSEEHHVYVTSYTAFRQDVDEYQNKSFRYLFLDEAQVMKNTQTKIAQLLRNFEVERVFALSGTPIENRLSELWSIFQIVLPGLLPNKKEFSKLTASAVSKLIQPFVLRRRKEDVLVELPDLIESKVISELTDQQKSLYLAQLEQIRSGLLDGGDEALQKRRIEILAGITRLRQICDTPKLFMDSYQGDSGKLASLRDLLERLKAEQHRVLIFSQFRQMLDLIAQEVDDLGMTSYLLTGSTPAKERQEMTQAFNKGSRDVFLISLKAGGVGLNLTGADTVILVDLWWNPAVEAQAISRAHRMGQEAKVECYRLITKGTIEEKIQELQASKAELVTSVLDGAEDRASLSLDDIRHILGLPPGQ
ncbi:DEAD/DEAH box helicase [Streptococcus suis]|uniref:DEAD/DEAH box helicase n=1 Tax=Streptococcus suis TaxID=1307 RepID=A0A4T2GKV0_STRSU|nr:DEAD/DEAH box helicase [Streptococcus suis]MBM7270348.1 DEAD/DEAH box helicase [Streptococcus suis]TIH98923.1 DEAD/DEAH box helicase [Streptococcus suis]